MLSQCRTRPEPPASQTPVTCGVCRPLRPQSIQDKNTPNPPNPPHSVHSLLTPYTPSSLRTLPDRNHFLIKSVLSTPKNKQSLRTKRSRRTLTKRWVEQTSSLLLSIPPAPSTLQHSVIFPALKPEIVPEIIVASLQRRSCSQNICVCLNFHFILNICSMCFCLDQAMSENGGEDNMVGRSR